MDPKDTIKLELPMEPLALKHAGSMLTAMAVELGALPIGAETLVITGDGSGAVLPPALDAGAPGAGADIPPPPEGVVLDAQGLPKDTRIHGSGNAFLKTGARAGCWKYKKGVDEALIATVEAELKAAMAAPAPLAAGTEVLPPLPAPPAPPAPGVAAGTEQPPVALDYPGTVQRVTALINEGRIAVETITAECVTLGLASYPLLAARPDLLPVFNERLDVLCPPIQ